jgi:hypothetical protein
MLEERDRFLPVPDLMQPVEIGIPEMALSARKEGRKVDGSVSDGIE